MAASNQQKWVDSVLNMDAKAYAKRWNAEVKPYVAPGVTTETGDREENLFKFRYSDVLCIDQTRVVLKNHEDDSDFIHANWLRPATPAGVNYICAQGPMAETSADFWHMVFSEEVSVIVMLTSFTSYSDASVQLCARYFPQRIRESMEFGEYTVTCVKIVDGPSAAQCKIRHFEIARSGGKTVEVKHAHVPYWMDWRAPSETAPILALRRWVHEQHDGRPVVVHGSAGVGRSLTFCAIDTALARIANDPATDLIQLAKELRAVRASAIDSHIQAMFLKCLVLDALVDEKKIAPYESSAFAKEFRRHSQDLNARSMARAMQERSTQVAAAA